MIFYLSIYLNDWFVLSTIPTGESPALRVICVPTPTAPRQSEGRQSFPEAQDVISSFPVSKQVESVLQ